MKIIEIRTIRPAIQPNLCFVEIRTDEGLVGLGESFYGASAVDAYLHDEAAPQLLGMTNPGPEAVSRLLVPYVGYQGGGAEQRGNGAIDMALWDLLSQRGGLTLAEVLGGPVRTAIRVYNTCAGPDYVSTTSQQRSSNWGLSEGSGSDRYQDLRAFLTRPAKLARELLDEGITGMKIWPFDLAAERTGGQDISESEIAAGVDIVEAIRAEVGWSMDVMIELHSLWNRRSATRIAQALTHLRPYWIEDPLRPDAGDVLAALRADIDIPVATGENAFGRRGFLPLLQTGAIDVVTVDVGWNSGITEAKKVADLADTFKVSVAPHDCTGPVSLAVATHLVGAQPNGLIQETTRSWLRTWYPLLVTGLPVVADGEVHLPEGPGHGVRLHEDLADRMDLVIRSTSNTT